MSGTESDLIERHFARLGAVRADVALGIGDDAAMVRVPPGMELVLTTDALVEGTHFLPGAPPRSLGHRALAVNLSDIAAMGAAPAWALLSLTLPSADESWLHAFGEGLGALAARHQVALVGGNLARGPLTITIQLAGLVPAGQALRRSGARPGDLLYVSGSVGDAGAGREMPGADAYLRGRFEFPTPRVALGQALRGLASACIDVSDGLYIDASRLLQASRCAGTADIRRLPLSDALRLAAGAAAWRQGLCGGEDYELCFTAAPDRAAAVEAAALAAEVAVTPIGAVQAGNGLSLRDGIEPLPFAAEGFDHFRS